MENSKIAVSEKIKDKNIKGCKTVRKKVNAKKLQVTSIQNKKKKKQENIQ